MTNSQDKKTLLLEEYMEGFSGIRSMVEQFEQLSPETQEIFIEERKSILEEQLTELRVKKDKYSVVVRRTIAQLNSRYKAYTDTERTLLEQIKECEDFWNIIHKKSEQTNDEEAK